MKVRVLLLVVSLASLLALFCAAGAIGSAGFGGFGGKIALTNGRSKSAASEPLSAWVR